MNRKQLLPTIRKNDKAALISRYCPARPDSSPFQQFLLTNVSQSGRLALAPQRGRLLRLSRHPVESSGQILDVLAV